MSDADTNLPLWLAFIALNEKATRDHLTGLYNRRYFDETLADHIAAAKRYERPLSLVLFDIDHFKQINDTQGHETGDDTLRKFAALLKSTARKADIVCRYGGDEFAVILPETGKTDAQTFAGRVVAVMEGMLAISAGIAALPCDNLIGAADSELLARKKECRQ